MMVPYLQFSTLVIQGYYIELYYMEQRWYSNIGEMIPKSQFPNLQNQGKYIEHHDREKKKVLQSQFYTEESHQTVIRSVICEFCVFDSIYCIY